MSSILKALKKLEHDKAVQKPETFRIDADILRGGSPRRSFSTGVLLAAIAVFACGVGATYFFMKTSTPSQISQTSKNEVRSEPLTGTSPVVPTPTLPVAETLPHTAEHQQHQPAKPSPAADNPERSTQSARNQALRAEIPPQTMAAPEPKPVTPSTPPSMAKPASLKVDGIAFQDGGTDGVAVVNGVTVSKGSVIEGARVEEIQKDRVKFSRGGEKFEIILDKSN
jgi:general secretion pathway protein B